MNRCATCKHFGTDYHPNKDGLADCGFVGTNPATDNKATAVAIKASAADDQGLSALLMVGPQFGCVHHDERKTRKRKFA